MFGMFFIMPKKLIVSSRSESDPAADYVWRAAMRIYSSNTTLLQTELPKIDEENPSSFKSFSKRIRFVVKTTSKSFR